MYFDYPCIMEILNIDRLVYFVIHFQVKKTKTTPKSTYKSQNLKYQQIYKCTFRIHDCVSLERYIPYSKIIMIKKL